MKDMNKPASIGNNFVTRIAEVVSDMLIHEADMGVKYSAPHLIYEPEFPIELLKESAQ